MSDDTVRVAVRIRPLVHTEIERGCQTCLQVVPGEQQIRICNTDKAFTFNYVFPPNIGQENFYSTAIQGTVNNIFHGYNVTILAYGQTGSGKTHSMGTNYSNGTENIGIIPRAMQDIFQIIDSKKDWTFKVTVSFMELYQEQLYDLLSDKQRSQSIVDIREDGKSIRISGVTEKEIHNAEEALECLMQGSLGRATGATAMNAQSSRSHAIFTLCIHQQKKEDSNTATTAKFHLVDLAGSERSKKTQATGERFREGININKGLLALGNVISQLGEGGPAAYVGYRDSKLTRLLQDSLGGNSMTLMIACVSPADYNLDETLSTLRYADRARKIKNKPIINQDPKVAEINRLNKMVQELKLALVDKEIRTSCSMEHQGLEEKCRSLQSKIRDLTEKLQLNLTETVIMHERAEKIESDIEEILEYSKELLDLFVTDPSDHTNHRNKLERIHAKILEIQMNLKKSEEYINLAACPDIQTCTMNKGEETKNTSADDILPEDGDCLEYYDEKQEEHTLRQAERNNEVQYINRELAIKEQLVFQLLKDSSHAIEHTKELQEMEQEIKTLQSEKEELQNALQNIHANNISSKLAESRRKKVQELEKKIVNLSKKCLEQTKVLKAKEKQDQQIKNLSKEIQTLKQTRVKLIRQMRNETDKFTKWKQSREKELHRLKDQDRKRMNEMTRLKLQHSKQESVFKRKMEEAFAINKRLKDALDVQKKASQRREKTSNHKNAIQTWITQELDVLVSTVDAELSLQTLMQDRASLVSQLEDLKNTENPDVEEINELTEFIDLRNAQITDLQQKILESDQENRANTRWQTIHTMTDAKTALKIVFDITAENRKKECVKASEYNELLEKYKLLQARDIENREKEKQQRRQSRQIMLNKTNTITEGSNDEVHKLQKELEVYKEKCRNLEQTVLNTSNGNKPKSKANRKTEVLSKPVAKTASPNSDDSLIDDVEKDPDWRKTPLFSRIQKSWNTSRQTINERVNLKRSSDGDVRCACKTKCSTRMCTCRKNGNTCSNCNCNPETCQNKDKENLARTLFFDTIEDQDVELMKRPRLLDLPQD